MPIQKGQPSEKASNQQSLFLLSLTNEVTSTEETTNHHFCADLHIDANDRQVENLVKSKAIASSSPVAIHSCTQNDISDNRDRLSIRKEDKQENYDEVDHHIETENDTFEEVHHDSRTKANLSRENLSVKCIKLPFISLPFDEEMLIKQCLSLSPNISSVNVCLEKSIDPNVPSLAYKKQTPLILALRYSNDNALIRTLLSFRANPFIRDKEGNNAFSFVTDPNRALLFFYSIYFLEEKNEFLEHLYQLCFPNDNNFSKNLLMTDLVKEPYYRYSENEVILINTHLRFLFHLYDHQILFFKKFLSAIAQGNAISPNHRQWLTLLIQEVPVSLDALIDFVFLFFEQKLILTDEHYIKFIHNILIICINRIFKFTYSDELVEILYEHIFNFSFYEKFELDKIESVKVLSEFFYLYCRHAKHRIDKAETLLDILSKKLDLNIFLNQTFPIPLFLWADRLIKFSASTDFIKEMMHLLLKKGANPLVNNKENQTIFHQLAKYSKFFEHSEKVKNDFILMTIQLFIASKYYFPSEKYTSLKDLYDVLENQGQISIEYLEYYLAHPMTIFSNEMLDFLILYEEKNGNMLLLTLNSHLRKDMHHLKQLKITAYLADKFSKLSERLEKDLSQESELLETEIIKKYFYSALYEEFGEYRQRALSLIKRISVENKYLLLLYFFQLFESEGIPENAEDFIIVLLTNENDSLEMHQVGACLKKSKLSLDNFNTLYPEILERFIRVLFRDIITQESIEEKNSNMQILIVILNDSDLCVNLFLRCYAQYIKDYNEILSNSKHDNSHSYSYSYSYSYWGRILTNIKSDAIMQLIKPYVNKEIDIEVDIEGRVRNDYSTINEKTTLLSLSIHAIDLFEKLIDLGGNLFLKNTKGVSYVCSMLERYSKNVIFKCINNLNDSISMAHLTELFDYSFQLKQSYQKTDLVVLRELLLPKDVPDDVILDRATLSAVEMSFIAKFFIHTLKKLDFVKEIKEVIQKKINGTTILLLFLSYQLQKQSSISKIVEETLLKFLIYQDLNNSTHLPVFSEIAEVLMFQVISTKADQTTVVDDISKSESEARSVNLLYLEIAEFLKKSIANIKREIIENNNDFLQLKGANFYDAYNLFQDFLYCLLAVSMSYQSITASLLSYLMYSLKDLYREKPLADKCAVFLVNEDLSNDTSESLALDTSETNNIIEDNDIAINNASAQTKVGGQYTFFQCTQASLVPTRSVSFSTVFMYLPILKIHGDSPNSIREKMNISGIVFSKGMFLPVLYCELSDQYMKLMTSREQVSLTDKKLSRLKVEQSRKYETINLGQLFTVIDEISPSFNELSFERKDELTVLIDHLLTVELSLLDETIQEINKLLLEWTQLLAIKIGDMNYVIMFMQNKVRCFFSELLLLSIKFHDQQLVARVLYTILKVVDFKEILSQKEVLVSKASDNSIVLLQKTHQELDLDLYIELLNQQSHAFSFPLQSIVESINHQNYFSLEDIRITEVDLSNQFFRSYLMQHLLYESVLIWLITHKIAKSNAEYHLYTDEFSHLEFDSMFHPVEKIQTKLQESVDSFLKDSYAFLF